MLVVHGFVMPDGGLALWAETDRRAGPWPATSRRPVTHPFAVQGRELVDLISAAGGSSVAQPPLAHPVDEPLMLLPTSGSAPLASPTLLTDPARRRRRKPTRLRPWRVPAVRIALGVDPRWIVERIPDAGQGSSIGYLGDVVDFAVELTSRGRVLPGLRTDHRHPGRASAYWEPVLHGGSAATFGALRRAMPPSCRAVPAGDRADGRDAADVLRSALTAAVDATVRGRLRAGDVTVLPPGPRPVATAEVALSRWLGALTGEASFEADPAQVDRLGERLSEWRTSGEVDSPVRTCFRLSFLPDDEFLAQPATLAAAAAITAVSDEDTGADVGGVSRDGGVSRHGGGNGNGGADDSEPADSWVLEFFLQPVEDLSMLVPATEVWRDAVSPLHRWLDHPDEQLLADLGRASRLYPDIDPALRPPRPTEVVLDTAGAYRFLTHAPLLEEAGFGVLLPAHWRQPAGLGLTLDVKTRETVTAVLRDDTVGLDAIVDYRWGLALGEQRLTESELRDVARAKVPLIRLRGQWVYLDRERLSAGLRFLAGGETGQLSAGEALQHAGLGLPSGAQPPLPVTEVEADGWLGELLSGSAFSGEGEQLELRDAPAGFGTVLRPYQRRGLSWLLFMDRLGLGACLADDMGLGKTVQLLALEARLRSAGRRAPTLLVCPLSVLGNWQRETARFAPELSVLVHHGAGRPTEVELARLVAGADLVLTTYAVATRDVEMLRAFDWDRVVLDEAQQIKNSASAASRAVRQLPARHRVALTGTPVENRLIELWSIMDFLNPGILASAPTFRARYAVPIERYRDESTAGRLRRATRPFLLRRMKTDPAVISDLPEKLEIKQLCNLTVEQATLYRAVVDEMFLRLRGADGVQRKGVVLAAMSKLKQVCNHPAQLLADGSALPGRSGKLDRLEEIIERVLAGGDKALCFTQFVRFGTMLAPYLAARFQTEVLFLHGGTAKGARDELVERFQTSDGPRIFLLSLKAGGTGLNLTAAQHIVHLDRWWNPAVEAQATDRAFRIGQDRSVRVHKFVCIGTLEEKIDRMIEDKSELAQLAVGTGDGWLTKLSTGELRELLTLTPEAVGD